MIWSVAFALGGFLIVGVGNVLSNDTVPCDMAQDLLHNQHHPLSGPSDDLQLQEPAAFPTQSLILGMQPNLELQEQ